MIRRKAALVGIAAGAIAVIAIPSAFAASTTYTIKSGSTSSGTQATKGSAGKITFKDTSTHQNLGCSGGTANATVKLGKKVAAGKAGKITKTTWQKCGGVLNTVLLPKQSGTWYINGSGKTKTGKTPISVSNVKAVVKQKGAASNCTFTVTGTAAGNYVNSTHSLQLVAKGDKLKVSHVIGGCYTLINNGDKVTFAATYKLDKNITINSN